MTSHAIRSIVAIALLGASLLPGAAFARNPHCAGGIQYVVGGLRDKDKGLAEDYMRQMNKAVQQLEMCSSEDPADVEATGYLGWAYAELDSCGPAGKSFQKAIDGLKAKGDVKKADWATNNRDSYWANKLNDGIAKINDAQQLYPDFNKKPDNESDQTLKDEAAKKYDEALASLTRASLLRPNHPQTIRTLGSVYAFKGDYRGAMAVFEAGLKGSPGDSALAAGLKNVRTNFANQLIDEKKYDEAIAYFSELVKTEPNNGDLWLGLASAQFSRASESKDEAKRKIDFKAAGDAYAKSAALKPGDADLCFNAGLAYQKAGEQSLAEVQWRCAVAARPGDPDALSALAETLAELKKYPEAIEVLQKGIVADPKNKMLHRQLGAIYNKAGNSAKSTEELLIFLALHNGKPVADPAAEAKSAKAGSAAAATLASQGVPDQINLWEGDGQKYATWFYWDKKAAYHFSGDGALASKSDWGSTATAKK